MYDLITKHVVKYWICKFDFLHIYKYFFFKKIHFLNLYEMYRFSIFLIS